MGQMCLYYFVVTLDKNTITTNETNAPYEKSNTWRTIDDVIFDFYASGVLKLTTYLESRQTSEQGTCVAYGKY